MSKQQADWRIKQCARERDALAATIKKNQEANERCAMAKWENDTHATIMRNKDKRLFHALQGQRAAELDRRRASLSQILRDEKEAFKQEMKDNEETTSQLALKLQTQALALKAKREAEREAFCNEKLYQQWRQGMDDLRVADSKLYELQVMACRDDQCNDRQERLDQEKLCDDIFYSELAKDYERRLEREKKEIAVRKKRNEVVNETIEAQIALREQKIAVEKEWDDAEKVVLKKLWAQHEIDEKTKKAREIKTAKEARLKVDEYLAIDRAIKEKEIQKNIADDKAMVLQKLKEEKAEADAEDAAKAAAKAGMLAHKEQMRLEGIKEKQSEAMLLAIQDAETEKQWRKRYAAWGKEAMQRRLLMEEVYLDRAQQIHDKTAMIEKNKKGRMADADNMQAEADRQAVIENEKQELQLAAAKKHQESLFKQMDEQQTNRHRVNQQKLFDHQQAMLAEKRLSHALDAEKQKQMLVAEQIAKTRDEMTEARNAKIAAEKEAMREAAQARLEKRCF